MSTFVEKDNKMKDILDWCTSVVGPCEVVSGDMRFHGRTTVCQLQTSLGHCYVKIYRQKDSWETEVHGYEQWASAFSSATNPLRDRTRRHYL